MTRPSSLVGGLARVEWARLEHAYGPAVDLPGLFRDFAAGDEAVRRRILHDWFGRLVHQGSRYSASPAAMPFLVELAAGAGACRGELARLLVALLVGFPDDCLLTGRPEDPKEPGLARELGAAFDAAVPRLRTLLGDPEAAVREDAAFALAWSPRLRRGSLRAVTAQLERETVPRVRASLLLALGWLGGARAELARALLPNRSLIERVAAAIAMSRRDPAPADAVVAALREVERAQAALAGRPSPWNSGDWVTLALAVAPRGTILRPEQVPGTQAPVPSPVVPNRVKRSRPEAGPALPTRERVLEALATSCAPLGERLLVVGTVTGVGHEAGCVLAYETATGRLLPTASVAGSAMTLAGDATGAVWASVIRDDRGRLVHWTASGDREPAFDVSVEGLVEVLGRIGSLLVVGGGINAIGGRPRSFLAAVDAETGEVSDFAPVLDHRVSALAVDGDELWVGGTFSAVDGLACRGVARFQWTGTTLRHCPEQALPFAQEVPRGASGKPSFGIAAIALDERYVVLAGWCQDPGRRRCHVELYRRGDFVHVASGSGIDGRGYRGAALAADRVWVCGDFKVAAGGGLVAALRLPGLEPLPLAPSLSETIVWDAIPSAEGPWLAGSFDVEGVTRRVARLDPATGEVRPLEIEPNGPVFRGLCTGSRLWVAGQMSGVVTLRARGAIAVAPSTLEAEPVAALQTRGTDYLLAAAALPDGRIAVAGSFSELGGQRREHLAVFDPTTGALSPFAPKLGGKAVGVHCAAGRLFVFGEFALVDDQVRPFVAAFDAHTLALLDWSPAPDRAVRALMVAGERVILGGEFRKVGGVTAPRLTAVSLSTGKPLPFPDADDHVRAFSVHADTLFIGGDFSRLGGERRSCLGAISLASNTVAAFAPALENGEGVVPCVYRLATARDVLFAQGHFASIDGVLRRQSAAFSAKHGSLLDFVPTDPELRAACEVGDAVLLLGSRIARYERL